MRSRRLMRSKRGITPVVATIILSAVVIAVGGAVWSYSQGAATVIANDYVNSTMTLLNEIIERFTVEHVSYEAGILHVWIYNYGDVDVVLDVYANATGGVFSSSLGNTVSSKTIRCVNVNITLDSGDEVAIKVHSRRQNNVYYTYYVP
ncbi:hypothetical protein DRO42_06120 [Candidatus Bathyarchaeota archaeon]|nr:MAG: hypothetical protein DRO42_06120 [Candidatus Bathyarchaeota archaeon]